MTKKHTGTMLVAYVFLIALCVIWVIPLIFSFATSFRSQTEIVSVGFRLLPVNWILDNYVAILDNTSTAPILQWLGNSLLISVSHTVLVVIVVAMTAYGYGRMRFKHRDKIFLIHMGISMFPSVVNLILLTKLLKRLVG